ncbi:MAG: GNAT family N-acetyltransferase [Thermoproteota archaeon]
MFEVKIRIAEDRDAKPVEDMVGEWLKWKIERAETFREALRERRHLILIAEAQSQIIGVLHLLFYLDVVYGGLNSHVLLLYVKEDYRGKGVGKALLDGAVKHAVERGVVEMHVDTVFEDAGKFYRKYGFKDDGVMLELSLTRENQLS